MKILFFMFCFFTSAEDLISLERVGLIVVAKDEQDCLERMREYCEDNACYIPEDDPLIIKLTKDKSNKHSVVRDNRVLELLFD